jgi:hypothetical protein
MEMKNFEALKRRQQNYRKHGCQSFLGTIYQNGGKYTESHTTTLPNGHKIYHMSPRHSEWPYNIPTFSIPRPSKFYPNWDFGLENIPSGNPDRD